MPNPGTPASKVHLMSVGFSCPLSLFSPFSFFLPLPFWALSLASFILRFLFFPAMAKEGAIGYSVLHTLKYSLVTQMVRNLSAVQETWVQSLGQEDPLQKGMTTHSSILAWKNPKDKGAWWATVH